jgi:hypothetical protein
MPWPKRNVPETPSELSVPVPPEMPVPSEMLRPASLPEPVPALRHDRSRETDELGRRPLAECLAAQIHELSRKDGAFFLHIDGVSGSGKSSFLDLLQKVLTGRPAGDDVWHVVRLNAPRVSASGPLWWSIMDAVFRGILAATRAARSPRVTRILWTEYAWRLSASHGALCFGISVAMVILLILPMGGEFAIPFVLQLVMAVIAIGALHIGFHGSLLARPGPGGVGGFVDLEDVSEHLGILFRRSGAKIAVFLDDLERCDTAAAPLLLKTCDSLFKDLPIAFVVAADRRWLLATLEEDSPATRAAAEPGRSVGYQMLSRMFQLSVSLPRVPIRHATRYWRTLVKGDGEVLENANESPEDWVFLDEANYLGLGRILDQNPRAMKRFLNAFSVMRLMISQSGAGVPAVQIAGWTAICLRWPLLAEYLCERPKDVAHFRYDAPPSEVPDLVRGLFLRPQVVAIMRGLKADSAFDERIIRALSEPFNNGGSLLGVA